MTAYVFTADWHSCYRNQWQKQLDPLIDQCNGLRALEIGSHEGRSALWLIDTYAPRVRLECIDVHTNDKVRARFLQNTQAARDIGQLVYTRGFSAHRLANLLTQRRVFDFIYIDGCHEAASVLTDATLAFTMLSRGGKLCFDDYRLQDPKRMRQPAVAIDAFIKCFKPFLQVLHKQGQVWVQKTRTAITT